MRFDGQDESSNVDDRRGSRMAGLGGGRGLGVGTVVLALAAWYFGIDPRIVLEGASMLQGNAVQEQVAGPIEESEAERQTVRFVKQVLRDTEKTWGEQFPLQIGRPYSEPRLVLFRGSTPTACGTGQSAMGPFYCPADQQVYLDLSFFDELGQRFQAPGDFAQAYVIAHEVGHHMQTLLGISEKIHQMRSRMSETQANAMSVRQELQADCFAGVWAHHANKSRKVLEPGDVEEGLRAATAIGDDTLQRAARGQVVPDSFTHGSAEQRVRWLREGLQSGSLKSCDTFNAASL